MNFNPFWRNLIDNWSELYIEPTNPQCQPLWYNQQIKVGGEVVYYNNWSNAGVNYVNDLLDNNGVFYNVMDFNLTYNLNENFLRFASIISAIPQDWKQEIIAEEEKLDLVVHKNIIKIRNCKNVNKYIYIVN